MGSPLRNIAVIDDDPRVLESLQNLLTSCGYTAQTYLSAESYLESGSLTRSNCIITDLGMKQMTGLELLQRVRDRGCDTPVIIITGRPSAHSEEFYLGKGANGFFRKPIDGQVLMTLIDELIQRA